MIEKKTKIYWLFILPGCLFIVFFMMIPLFSLIFKTFFDEGGSFSLESYFSLFGSIYFQQVFWRSIRLSLLSTVVCALLGFPTAYYISKYSKNKGMLMALAVFPMFTSPVIRSFSWMVILGKKGFINTALVSLGIVSKPIGLLYNEFSMIVGFIQLFLPLMILSLIGIMDNISEDLNLAACNLGATKLGAFRHIVLPLSIPGLVTGSVLVFTGCLTAYTTPQLLGGTDTRVLATMIYQQAMSLGDWTQASVVAVVMIVVTILVSSVINGISRKFNPTI
ncbi:ABC transporter permease [Clostridium sp. chh4-2]|uniref:ABC transporter permease n=1 Tax=Clostridium sp. chh4-2 TaxID=2067550 RepID=UPI001A9A393E|nr:ABC transporter permease [Clostridium sp. chh4-2]